MTTSNSLFFGVLIAVAHPFEVISQEDLPHSKGQHIHKYIIIFSDMAKKHHFFMFISLVITVLFSLNTMQYIFHQLYMAQDLRKLQEELKSQAPSVEAQVESSELFLFTKGYEKTHRDHNDITMILSDFMAYGEIWRDFCKQQRYKEIMNMNIMYRKWYDEASRICGWRSCDASKKRSQGDLFNEDLQMTFKSTFSTEREHFYEIQNQGFLNGCY